MASRRMPEATSTRAGSCPGRSRSTSSSNLRRAVMSRRLIAVSLVTSWLSLCIASPASAEDARLIQAARKGDVTGIRLLLKQHVDVNTRAADGASALHWAAHGDY